MDYTHFVGIDVSKNTFDFAVLAGREQVFHMQASNDAAGIRDFMKRLKSLPGFCQDTTLFCMEHTGIYNQHLLHFLFAKKAKVCLESSVHIKLSSGLQRGKNDKIDALRIAQYAHRNRDELKLWQPKREVVQQLKHFAALRSRLMHAKTQLKVAFEETATFDKRAAAKMHRLCKTSLHALKQDIAKTDQAIAELIAGDTHLSRLFEVITSVQGIGKVTATAMIVATNEFKDINEPKKFACYAGVVPFEKSSGTIRGKARVSHRANKSMKLLLHMAAMVAVNYNDDLKRYYERKLQENKNKMAVLNAVRNKLVHRVFACVRENRLYQNKCEPTLV